jgi:hypothetical protein
VAGSFEYHGGAWVTPTRNVPRDLIDSIVPAASTGIMPAKLVAATVAPAAMANERRLIFMSDFLSAKIARKYAASCAQGNAFNQ